jgi:hypothetical protein
MNKNRGMILLILVPFIWIICLSSERELNVKSFINPIWITALAIYIVFQAKASVK